MCAGAGNSFGGMSQPNMNNLYGSGLYQGSQMGFPSGGGMVRPGFTPGSADDPAMGGSGYNTSFGGGAPIDPGTLNRINAPSFGGVGRIQPGSNMQPSQENGPTGGFRDAFGMPLTGPAPADGVYTRKPGAFRGMGFDEDTKRSIRQAYRQGDVGVARDIFREAGGTGFRKARGIMDLNMGKATDFTDPNVNIGSPVLFRR